MITAIFDAPKGHYEVVVGQQKDFMGVQDNAVTVEVGFQVHIDVKPEVYEPSKAFSNLPLNQRKCILNEELDTSMDWQLFK